MSESRNRDFTKYDAMATEELEEILRADSLSPEGQGSDGELLLYVMGVLAHRKRNSENPGKTAQKAWESFEEHYLPKEEVHTAKKSYFRRWVAVAAVVAVLLAVPLSAGALTWDEIWSAVASWAKETFSFVSQGQTDPTEPSERDDRPYNSLQELLAETNSETNIVPTWIPDRYSLVDITMDENPIRRNYIAFYSNGNTMLKISVCSYLSSDPEKIEVNEDLLEIYSAGDVEYYIFTNMDQFRAVWIINSYECYISGNITVEEMKQMIDSIGKG